MPFPSPLLREWNRSGTSVEILRQVTRNQSFLDSHLRAARSSRGRKKSRAATRLLQPLGQDKLGRVPHVRPNAGLAVGGEEDIQNGAAGTRIGRRDLFPELAAAG